MPRIDRRVLIGALESLGIAASCSRSSDLEHSFTIEKICIDVTQRARAQGTIIARHLCAQYLERIASLNPIMHAVIETNPEAL